VWEIAFILEEEGFFAHKDTKSSQQDIQKTSHLNEKGTLTGDDNNSGKKSQGRRKRSF
jgi:hypothetical protein